MLRTVYLHIIVTVQERNLTIKGDLLSAKSTTNWWPYIDALQCQPEHKEKNFFLDAAEVVECGT